MYISLNQDKKEYITVKIKNERSEFLDERSSSLNEITTINPMLINEQLRPL